MRRIISQGGTQAIPKYNNRVFPQVQQIIFTDDINCICSLVITVFFFFFLQFNLNIRSSSHELQPLSLNLSVLCINTCYSGK